MPSIITNKIDIIMHKLNWECIMISDIEVIRNVVKTSNQACVIKTLNVNENKMCLQKAANCYFLYVKLP